MSDAAEQRRAMRLVMRTRRAELDEDDQAAASMAVMARLARVPVLREATIVSGYRAVRGELDIDAALILLAERGATVTVPRVSGEHMEFVRWNEGQSSVSGAFGIDEPVGDATIPLRAHEVVLAPLVAFDDHGNRLGQGGGFYDRALAACGDARPIVIGVAHGFQRVDGVPQEAWDQRLDAVVTEDEVVEFRPGVLDVAI
ncbi:MAG: 5-formyltetrahydrofolate cyclo-ligase [Actinomycetota bacterium]